MFSDLLSQPENNNDVNTHTNTRIMQAVSVPKKSVKPRVTPTVAKQALESFEERFTQVRAKLNKANDVDASNVENVRKLSRYLSLYVQLNMKKATNETKRESENILRKAFDIAKRAESEGDFQGQKLVGNSRFTEKGAGRFATKAMKYLMKVYDRVDSAEVREDGTYGNDVFSVPEEGIASQLDAPVQPAPAPAPAQPAPQTQTAEQTAATLAGEGAGALPTATAKVDFTPQDPQEYGKTDGTTAGGSSNDAGEDDNVSLAGDEEEEKEEQRDAEAGDTSTATGLKTGGGTTNPIGATADDIAAARAQVADRARADEAQARDEGTRPNLDPQTRKELEDALKDYVPVRPGERTPEDEQKFFIAKSVADELGIPRDAPAYPKARTREGNTNADYFINAMEGKGTTFFELYEEDDYGYAVMELEPGDTYNLNEETGEVYVVKQIPNITGQRRGREGDDEGNRGGAKQRTGGGEPNVTEQYKQAVLQAYLREGSVYINNLNAQAEQVLENARKATEGMYGAPGGAPRGQEGERRYQELVAQVNRITQEAQARVERVAREQAEGGADMPLPGTFINFYSFGAQNSFEALNQLIQKYGVGIPNAVERQAFIASMEQGEREDVREEARQAQVPAEAQKQRREAQQQRAAELREQQNAPPQIPAPVDVDIDIASLSLGDAGSVPSTQQVGDAMTQDKAKESTGAEAP
jgi:hypothetical protein